MPRSAVDDNKRMNLRVRPEQKAMLVRAAALRNTDLTDFVLQPASLNDHRGPAAVQRGLARRDIPGFRLARIAVARAQQGRGLGGQLLLAAGRRCLMAASVVGGTVLIIDARSDRAAGWCTGYGAMPLRDAERTLVLPLATIERLLKDFAKRGT
jgi:GNAT superfamily N-acetyltransferase